MSLLFIYCTWLTRESSTRTEASRPWHSIAMAKSMMMSKRVLRRTQNEHKFEHRRPDTKGHEEMGETAKGRRATGKQCHPATGCANQNTSRDRQGGRVGDHGRS